MLCLGLTHITANMLCHFRELGRQHREEQERKRALLMEGHKLYKEYCEKGREGRQEKLVSPPRGQIFSSGSLKRSVTSAFLYIKHACIHTLTHT